MQDGWFAEPDKDCTMIELDGSHFEILLCNLLSCRCFGVLWVLVGSEVAGSPAMFPIAEMLPLLLWVAIIASVVVLVPLDSTVSGGLVVLAEATSERFLWVAVLHLFVEVVEVSSEETGSLIWAFVVQELALLVGTSAVMAVELGLAVDDCFIWAGVGESILELWAVLMPSLIGWNFACGPMIVFGPWRILWVAVEPSVSAVVPSVNFVVRVVAAVRVRLFCTKEKMKWKWFCQAI